MKLANRVSLMLKLPSFLRSIFPRRKRRRQNDQLLFYVVKRIRRNGRDTTKPQNASPPCARPADSSTFSDRIRGGNRVYSVIKARGAASARAKAAENGRTDAAAETISVVR